jgi:hypothetical protein
MEGELGNLTEIKQCLSYVENTIYEIEHPSVMPETWLKNRIQLTDSAYGNYTEHEMFMANAELRRLYHEALI